MDTVANGFPVLWADLKSRFFTPPRHVTFWAYLFIGVVLFGGLAVWGETYYYFVSGETATHLRIALVAYFPALVGSVSLQLVFEEAGRNKRMLSFAIVAGVIFFLIAIALIWTKELSNSVAIPFAALSCVLAILHWWIANGLNPAFQDEFNFEAPVGGPPTQTPAGDTGGFRT